VSEWQGETNINSASIGIELVNGGHDFPDAQGNLPIYPDIQINALIALCKDIISRHGPLTLLGHSDIAPSINVPDSRVLFEAGSRDRGVAIVQRGLTHIGYSARVSGVMDVKTVQHICALQRRYRPDKIDGVVDVMTMDIIKTLIENLSSFSPQS